MSQSPGGFPPYGQMQPAPAPRTNVPAIISLICGILGCIPFITSLLAIILGIVGIKSSNQPGTGGKGMAIAGLILGIVGILGWGLFGGGAAFLYYGSAKPRAVARQFAQDISAGNVEVALGQCDSTKVKREEIEAAVELFKKSGPLKSVTLIGVRGNTLNGVTEWQVGGAIAFVNQDVKTYSVTLRKEGDDYKVVRFKFE